MLKDLFENNRTWAQDMLRQDPHFFSKLGGIQTPEYLWIGCADSRVPANQITGLAPGEVFVHRNVSNVVVHTDLNCLSVVQYAVDVLKVKHVMVVGHYGCGGVYAALHGAKLGLIDNWLRHVQDVMLKHAALFSEPYEKSHWDALCELNVIEQVVNLAQTTVVQQAWERGQAVAVHGWVYNLNDGILRDLDVTVNDPGQVKLVHANAVAAVAGRVGAK